MSVVVLRLLYNAREARQIITKVQVWYLFVVRVKPERLIIALCPHCSSNSRIAHLGFRPPTHAHHNPVISHCC